MLSIPRSGPLSLGSGLPLEPWLTGPISSSGSPLQSLPSFITPQQGVPASYTPPQFLSSSTLNHPLPHIGAVCPPPPAYQCSGFMDKFSLEEADPRNTSIASLRMKAKEHIQSIGKTWQTESDAGLRHSETFFNFINQTLFGPESGFHTCLWFINLPELFIVHYCLFCFIFYQEFNKVCI